jgi:hypothetical protein
MTEGEQVGFHFIFAGLLARQRAERQQVLLVEYADSMCVFNWQ